MRVHLAATTLVVPTIVGAKLTSRRGKQLAGPQLQLNHRDGGEPAVSATGRKALNRDQPIWKSRLNRAISKPFSAISVSHVDEPDLGILAANPRRLEESEGPQTTSNSTSESATSIIDLCLLLSQTDSMSCDCSNWNELEGSFTCSLYNGDEYCFEDAGQDVCGTAVFQVEATASEVDIGYCVYTVSPSKHSYCSNYQMSADSFVNSGGNFVGAAGNCTITIDGTQCNSCTIQTDCHSARNGAEIPGPGPFDCTNTEAGTSGNQCLNDAAFPLFSLPPPDQSPEDNPNSPNSAISGGVQGTGNADGSRATRGWATSSMIVSGLAAALTAISW